jgi:hypothetical protein
MKKQCRSRKSESKSEIVNHPAFELAGVICSFIQILDELDKRTSGLDETVFMANNIRDLKDLVLRDCVEQHPVIAEALLMAEYNTSTSI